MAAVFPQLESGEKVWGTKIGGAILSMNLDELEKVCRKARVKELYSFYRMTRDECIYEIDGEPDDPSSYDEKELNVLYSDEWYSPEEGLITISCMLDYVLDNGSEFERVGELLEDLHDFKSVLEEARANGIRWHLSHDV